MNQNLYSKYHILLDAGHSSGKAKNITPGKRTPYLVNGSLPALSMYEGDFNRDVVKRIESKLKNLGYNVDIIVPEDEDITLTTRVRRVNELCKTYGAANCVLVSIHSNAAGVGSKWLNARGFQVHVCFGCSKKSITMANCLYNAAFADGWFKMRKPTPNKLYWENNYTILKKSNCPAILSENGFYDNSDDCTYLLTSECRERVAEYHTKAIIEYLKSIVK